MQTIMVSHDTFVTFGYGFGDISALLDLHLTWFSVPVMTGLGKFVRRTDLPNILTFSPTVVAFIGQSFYAYRVHVLSKSYFTSVLIVIVRKFIFSRLGSFTMKKMQVSLTSSICAFMTGAFAQQGTVSIAS